MPRQSLSTSCVLAAALAAALAGCAPADEGVYIQATLVGDHDEAVDYGSHLLVRAVPDHQDGFSPDRPYIGERALADQCPIDHVEFPLEFGLFGPDDVLNGAPRRWVLLGWMTDDVEATWVAPGELYGTVTFEYWHDPYFGHVADGLVVRLENVRP